MTDSAGRGSSSSARTARWRASRWLRSLQSSRRRSARPSVIMLAAVTIAISIQTSTAAIFAADSKLTTSGLVGFDDAGEPQFVGQTYDNATKIVRDTAGCAMAVVAGVADFGRISVMDYLASSEVPRPDTPEEQNAAIREFAAGMGKLRAIYWRESKVTADKWPITVVLLAVAPRYASQPAAWRIVFRAEEPDVINLMNPVYLEGSYDGAFSLLYGYRSDVMRDLAKTLSIDDTKVVEALDSPKVLRPIDKLPVGVMPIQDAVDLAVFLASTQVQMERFLPGEPLCGGPIDVMVLKAAPTREILWFPGKVLKHPLGHVG